MSISFKVNGKSTSVDVPPDMPLLWVLRDVLDLKGTKFGCGMAQCGACTVHAKGTPTRSCVTPVAAVKGADVTTIEGLSADGTHPRWDIGKLIKIAQDAGFHGYWGIESSFGQPARGQGERRAPSGDLSADDMWNNEFSRHFHDL